MSIDTPPIPAGARLAESADPTPGPFPVLPKIGVFGCLLLTALVLRLPFLFPDVIDWDESTFILVGQSLLDGYLPYTQLWALKPPLAFAFFSVVIAIFGKSLIAIRLAGTVCVAVSAFFVYLTATRLCSRRVGIVAATLCVAAVSLLPAGQATMTEHVALVPVTWALYLLIRSEPSVGTCFSEGVLLSVATLVRLNMAYVAILVGLYVLIVSISSAAGRAARYAAAYACGGGLVVASTWLPYVLSGQQGLWWTSVVVAPLSYVHSRSSAWENLVTQSMQALGMHKDERGLSFDGSLFTAFLWLAGAGGAAVLVRRWHAGKAEGRGVVVLALFIVGVVLGIVNSGDPYAHHLLQLAPFAAVLTALLVDQFSGVLRSPSLLFVGLLIMVSLRPVVDGYNTVMSRALAHEPLRYGAAYEIAAYVKRENTRRRPVYLLTDHIAYWFSDSHPPTKLTAHPSNIAKRWLLETVVGKSASTEEELRKVFRQRPEFVVMPERLEYLEEGAGRLLAKFLEDEYLLVTEIESRRIYRVRSSP